jgi:hypothetical protein
MHCLRHVETIWQIFYGIVAFLCVNSTVACANVTAMSLLGARLRGSFVRLGQLRGRGRAGGPRWGGVLGMALISRVAMWIPDREPYTSLSIESCLYQGAPHADFCRNELAKGALARHGQRAGDGSCVLVGRWRGGVGLCTRFGGTGDDDAQIGVLVCTTNQAYISLPDLKCGLQAWEVDEGSVAGEAEGAPVSRLRQCVREKLFVFLTSYSPFSPLPQAPERCP